MISKGQWKWDTRSLKYRVIEVSVWISASFTLGGVHCRGAAPRASRVLRLDRQEVNKDIRCRHLYWTMSWGAQWRRIRRAFWRQIARWAGERNSRLQSWGNWYHLNLSDGDRPLGSQQLCVADQESGTSHLRAWWGITMSPWHCTSIWPFLNRNSVVNSEFPCRQHPTGRCKRRDTACYRNTCTLDRWKLSQLSSETLLLSLLVQGFRLHRCGC